MRIAYVVKRYPRYSETFIVNEILAHEAGGAAVEIFALLPGTDTHFQDVISRVRAPVNYLPGDSVKAAEFWQTLSSVCPTFQDSWASLAAARGEEARYVHQALALARLVLEKRITHIHAHFATSATNVARMASRFTGVPFTFTAHAKDIFHESVNETDFVRKLEEAAAVITVSDFNVAHLRQRFGAAAVRVVRIYNGMDLTRLEYTSPRGRAPLILGAGRLVEKKGFDVLLDACSLLVKRGRRFKCQIVGTGDQETQLHARQSELGLSNEVEFLGPRPQRELFELIRQASVLAVPCVVGTDGNRDGLPTVLLEAMALGTPCVSTDVTGIPEVVRDGQTGLCVAQHDPAALAAAFERLLDDPSLAISVSSAARRLIEREFDIQVNSARLREVFAGAGGSEATQELATEPKESFAGLRPSAAAASEVA
jgi:glycosyltransferase involved in cell wall biosynthesis